MTDWQATGTAARQWWRQCIAPNSGTARAIRARLRRAAGQVEILSLAETHRLNLSLPAPIQDPVRLALLVRVLAHVDTDVGSPLARQLGTRTGDGRALSEIRFQRIVRATAQSELALPLIRALPIAKRTCNVASLARDLVGWGDRVRARWCFDYFGADAPRRLSAEAGGSL